jgi:hypothetical protein
MERPRCGAQSAALVSMPSVLTVLCLRLSGSIASTGVRQQQLTTGFTTLPYCVLHYSLVNMLATRTSPACSLDFLRKCRELSEWYGPSFYFVANPLMLPFPLHPTCCAESAPIDMSAKVGSALTFSVRY